MKTDDETGPISSTASGLFRLQAAMLEAHLIADQRAAKAAEIEERKAKLQAKAKAEKQAHDDRIAKLENRIAALEKVTGEQSRKISQLQSDLHGVYYTLSTLQPGGSTGSGSSVRQRDALDDALERELYE